MNLRQKKKQYKRITGENPPAHTSYSSLDYHDIIDKPWGGLAQLKKRLNVKAIEDFNKNISNRNLQIRTSRRYIR